MPTVSVNREQLFKELGQKYTDEEFDELCFKFGLEVDDVVDDPEKGVTYKIEVGANRYDLLCLEGISLALNVFLGRAKLPRYRITPALKPDEYRLIVKPATSQVRPYVVGAVLRDITFTQSVYDSFIELQDKLHQNLCRKRSLVAIGTHDLDTIQGPFIYDARKPKDISFVPLNKTETVRSDVLLDQYSHDSHLKEYVPIIKDKPVYPVILDKNGVVLSLPPIINGDHSKITLKTRNVFIECTCTDKYKGQIVLDTLVCMFSKYCKEPFTVEPVMVEYQGGEKIQYPKLHYRQQEATVQYCNTLVGVEQSAETMANLLTSMSLTATAPTPDLLSVEVPPTRYDVLHACDIAEDVAVAFGFDKLTEMATIPVTNTIGEEFPLNYLSDKFRHLLAQHGYSEAATFSLLSMADMGERVGVDLSKVPFVKVENPKTSDCEAVRVSLLPGLLKTTASNKHIPLPLRIFEITDISLKEEDVTKSRGTGARNERHLAALQYSVKAGVEVVHSLLDHIMLSLHIPFVEDESDQGYYLTAKDHPSYQPGFCGAVMVKGEEIGRLGRVHPQALLNFNLNQPMAALELNLEKLLAVTDQTVE